MADESGDGLQYAPIHRVAQACVSCRRKKARCTGNRPACANCRRLRIECFYTDITPMRRERTTQPGSVGPSQREPAMNVIAERLYSIECTLQQLSSHVQSIQHKLTSEGKETHEPPRKRLRATRDTQITGEPTTPIPASPHETNPSNEVIRSVIDTFFASCQNQPYSFFHEGHFRQRFEAADIPQHLILAMMVTAIRFSTHPYFATDTQDIVITYANRSWKSAVSDCLMTGRALDVDLVQTLGLLSLFDFTAGKSRHVGAWLKAGLAVRIAQDLGLMLDQTFQSSFVDQEERRRVFWSVYLLDRFVSCGRDKPHAILDSSVHLQLPCSESAWEEGNQEKTLTLEELENQPSTRLDSLGAFGQVIALASILGRSSQYSLQDFNIRSRHSPWNPSSDFAAIEFDLLHLESHLGLEKPIEELLPSSSSLGTIIDQSKTIPAIFARVLFHLCYCLLNHPFLLRRRIASRQVAAPSSFLSRAFNTGLQHAQQMIKMLAIARKGGCIFNASFCSYCVMVASSIVVIHRLDGNRETQANADRLIQEALEFLENSAKNWPNISNMVTILRRLLDRTAAICHLSSYQPEIESLTPADTDMMWLVVDYNAISKRSPTDFVVYEHSNHGQLPEANIWFESFFDTCSGFNVSDFISFDSVTDDSDLVGS